MTLFSFLFFFNEVAFLILYHGRFTLTKSSTSFFIFYQIVIKFFIDKEGIATSDTCDYKKDRTLENWYNFLLGII